MKIILKVTRFYEMKLFLDECITVHQSNLYLHKWATLHWISFTFTFIFMSSNLPVAASKNGQKLAELRSTIMWAEMRSSKAIHTVLDFKKSFSKTNILFFLTFTQCVLLIFRKKKPVLDD